MTYRKLILLQLSIAICTAFLHEAGEDEEDCAWNSCTVAYDRTMEYEGLRVGKEERYCQVLSTFRGCLNETVTACHGNINFHSAALYTSVLLRDNDCDRVLAKVKSEGREVEKCRLPAAPSPSSLRHCSIWGDPHIRTFDARVHACAEVGARPLIDNRYVLVQVSTGRVREDSVVVSVSKITVIVREHTCSAVKRYEASSETEHLPYSFVDGTTHSTVDGKRAVEVLRQSPDHIELILHHANIRITVRRGGPYLSVAITLPSHVLAQAQLPYSSGERALPLSEQICHNGCPLHSFVPLPAALANPQSFSNCHGAPLLLPIKIATERCKSFNVTDDFFDSCVFDLVSTGDELLGKMSRDAQSDLEKQLTQSRPYSVGRVDLTLYDHLINHFWMGCRPSSSFSPQTLISVLILTILNLV